MPAYSIYEKPGLPIEETIDSAVIVKDHYSMLAFIFPVLWIIIQRLWRLLAAYLLLLTPFIALDSVLPVWSGMLTTLLISLWLSLEAPNLIGWNLKRKGYVDVLSLYAEDRQHCELRYVNARLDAAKQATQNTVSAYPVAGKQAPIKTQDRFRASDQKKSIIGLFPAPEQAQEIK